MGHRIDILGGESTPLGEQSTSIRDTCLACGIEVARRPGTPSICSNDCARTIEQRMRAGEWEFQKQLKAATENRKLRAFMRKKIAQEEAQETEEQEALPSPKPCTRCGSLKPMNDWRVVLGCWIPILYCEDCPIEPGMAFKKGDPRNIVPK